MCAAVIHADTFDALVSGLQTVTCGTSPGPVYGTASNWVAIVGGDDDTAQPSTLVLARTFAQGRVVIGGHDGMLNGESLSLFDNGRLTTNIIYWLRGTNGPVIQYTTGHGEWASGLALGPWLTNAGFTITAMASPITTNKLAAGSVLIVGNAWNDFTANEIQAVREFVSQGGGLFLAGLGWSWSAYHPENTMEDYPMTRMAAPYGARWHSAGISDPTNQTNGVPVFHTFYPNVVAGTPVGAMVTINNAHNTHGTYLPSVLETNVPLRTAFAAAHAYLAIPSTELPLSDPSRVEVMDFYLRLLENWPSAYARKAPINQTLYPTTVWLRERTWRTLNDCLPLTAERKAAIADAAQLTGPVRDIYLEFGLLLLDNCRLANNQLGYIHALVSFIPAELHNLRAISVGELLGTSPTTISLVGLPNSVNIFGAAITGGPIENQFPPDVPPGNVKIFCGAAAHEVNHVVDAYTVGWSPSSTLATRRKQLINEAGTNDLSYLRSGPGNGTFFVFAPQEFFASIANQWFTDSAKVFQLAWVRFQAGLTNPVNQALFFADVYSRGGLTTCFYYTDLNGNLSLQIIPLRRDAQGRITGLQSSNTFFSLTLNQNSNVTAFTKTSTSPPTLAASVSGRTLRLSWPEIPLGYNLEWSSELTSSAWRPVTNVTVLVTGEQNATIPLESDARFFRLRSVVTSP